MTIDECVEGGGTYAFLHVSLYKTEMRGTVLQIEMLRGLKKVQGLVWYLG